MLPVRLSPPHTVAEAHFTEAEGLTASVIALPQDGRAMVIGGFNGEEYLKSCVLYNNNPKAKWWETQTCETVALLTLPCSFPQTYSSGLVRHAGCS